MTKLWKIVRDLIKISDGEIVFIGGIAVYLHAARRRAAKLPPETTHDVDAALSLVAAGSMRDELEVVPNPRLKKAQVKIGEIDVDLYVEYQNGLRFDYQELAQYATTARKLKIAALGHLLLLKIDAYLARSTSARGAKDRRDIAKILVLLADASKEQRDLVIGHAVTADLKVVAEVLKSSAFMEIAKHNAKIAAELRKRAQRAITVIQEEASW
jgi:hypothetical protein